MKDNVKKCSKCLEFKSLDEFSFIKSRNKHFSWCKPCLYSRQQQRWKSRRLELIKLFGGKCSKCGYNKNYAALDFHHLDPKEKEYDWSKLRLQKWETVINEAKKCILVCRNCHSEIHYPDCAFDNVDELTNANNRLNYESCVSLMPSGVCPVCQKEVYGTKYCSVDCCGLGSRKVDRPSKEELAQLLSCKNWCEIGRMYNVSDNAIRKWAKKYNI